MSYICKDCGERVDEDMESILDSNPDFPYDKYDCKYCGVYDETTGEV